MKIQLIFPYPIVILLSIKTKDLIEIWEYTKSNPDKNRDGLLDNDSKGFELKAQKIDSILPGQVKSIYLQITYDLKDDNFVNVFIDPLNEITEMNETNNIASKRLIESKGGSTVVPEFPPMLGIVIIFLLIIIISINRKKTTII